MTETPSAGEVALIQRLERAIDAPAPEAVSRRVKAALEALAREDALSLPKRFRRAHPEHYARRLLHRDPARGYTAVVMAWGPGQRTGLHDHAGMWCVELVVEGAMAVTQYDLVAREGGTYRFAERASIRAGVGSVGALIPPFEYHILANALADQPSVTLHVYGGDMTHCSLFEPLPDGRYLRRSRALSFDE